MKKIVYSLFLILTGVATLVSCQKDEADFSLSAVIADKPEVVSNPNAKAYIEEVNSVYYARWHNGDIVNINNQPCTLSVSSTSAAAVINNITLSGSGYTAVYPYGAGALDGTTATVTIPATQTYHTAQANGSSGASYQVVDGPMVARCASGDNVLRFHNAAGIIRVHVNNTTAETLKVHYVSVESSDGSYLAGSGTVDATSETPKLAEIASNGSKSVTLDCCDDATDKHPEIAPSGSMDFYLAVSPFSGKQLKIKVMTEDVDDDGKYKYIFSSTTTQAGGLSLDRNEISSVSMSLKAANRQELLFYGAGTKDCPFLIESYDDLDQLRTIVNSGDATVQSTYNTNQIHYLQTADINIGENTTTWGANYTTIDYSIGYNTTYPFKANYNGGNHNLTINSALGTNIQFNDLAYGIGIFGVGGGGGSISNVRAVGSISAGTRDKIIFGGIVGLICGDFSISNCSSRVNISLGNYPTNYEYNGGICGYVDASSSKVLFENCTYSGTLTYDQKICFGSIVAKISNASICTLKSCSNTEKTLSVSYGSVGGLVGDASAPVSFSGCTNNWNITATDKYKVGGIIGNSTNTVEIDGCTNNGNISCSGQVGGFVGYSSGKVTIKGTSSNSGEIEGKSTTSKAGGCIGEAFGDVDISGTLTNSGYIHGDGSKIAGIVAHAKGAINIDGSITNSGDIYVSTNYGDIGGIIGYSTSAVYINKDCSDLSKKVINTGSLTSGGSNHGSGSHAMGNGGIIGTAIGIIQIKNCYNEGDVSLKCSVGGIVGCISISGVSYIENCLNTGNIRGWVTKDWGNGGIVGDLASASNATRFYIRNCGNEGNVTTGDGSGSNKGYAAGIVGFAYSNGAINLDIKNCYSKDVTISGVKVGGILTGKYKSSNNIDIIVSNCYFEGTLSGSTGAGSVSHNDGSLTHLYYTYCYSDNTTDSETPTANEGSDNKSSGNKKAARTFKASDGKYADKSATVSSTEWTTDKLLVDALNSQVTSGNGYRTWVTPTGKVLPTLGL